MPSEKPSRPLYRIAFKEPGSSDWRWFPEISNEADDVQSPATWRAKWAAEYLLRLIVVESSLVEANSLDGFVLPESENAR